MLLLLVVLFHHVLLPHFHHCHLQHGLHEAETNVAVANGEYEWVKSHLFLFVNITARRTIAEREKKFYFIARRIIARRAIKLLIIQLYFPLTAEKNGGDEKTQREAL